MFKLTPLKVTLGYAIFGIVWILFSDAILRDIVQDHQLEERLELAKGLFFVVFTSSVLYLLLKVWREPLLKPEIHLENEDRGPNQKRMQMTALALVLIIPLLSLTIIQIYAPQQEKEALDDMQLISKLKANQIHNWVEEREGDTRVFLEDKRLMADIESLLNGRAAQQSSLENLKRLLNEKFASLVSHYGYSSVLLIDSSHHVIIKAGDLSGEETTINQAIRKLSPSQTYTHTSLYLDSSAKVHLDWIVPIRDKAQPSLILGVVVLRANPEHFILPFINIWPVHHKSAETMLVDPETGSALYLSDISNSNKLKLVEKNVLSENIPLIERSMGSERSAVFVFKNNQQRDVLAAYESIPSIGWRVVTKVDKDDVLQSLYSEVLWVGLVAFLGVMALSVMFIVLWKQRHHIHNLAVIAEKNKTDNLVNEFFNLPFVGMAVISATDRSFIKFNPHLCNMLGYTQAELLGLSIEKVLHQDSWVEMYQMLHAVMIDKKAPLKHISKFVRKNGDFLNVLLDAKLVSPIDNSASSVLITVSDITELLTIHDSLAIREGYLSAIFKAIPDLVWIKDMDGVYIDCNTQFTKLYGASEVEIIGHNDYRFVNKELADFFRENDLKAAHADGPSINEEWLVFKGEKRSGLFETIKTPIKNSHGEIIGILGIARDITERAEAQSRIKRLNQLYALQAKANSAIVRSVDEVELFQSICQYAVEIGGFAMVFVGEINPDTQLLKAVASYGSGIEYLDGLEISKSENLQSGRGPTGTCMRLNQPQWVQDFQNDVRTLYWHDRAKKFDWNASASLPLLKNGHVYGAITLYSKTRGAMDEEVQVLLEAITLDINYAIKNLDIERDRKQKELQLNKLSLAVEQSPNSIVITDLEANIEYVNDAFVKITGYTADDVIGKNPRIMQSGATAKSVYDEMWSTLTQGLVWKGELVNKRKDGSIYTELASISPVRDASGAVSHYLAIKTDITEKKAAEKQLMLAAKVFEQGNEGIMITDEHSNIIMVNRAFSNISGYSNEEVKGKKPSFLSSGKHDINFYQDMWKTIQKHGYWKGEIWNKDKNGRIYPEMLSISKVLDEQSHTVQYIGIFTDITENKQAEENIKWLAHFDVLTGLPNRVLLNDRVNQALSSAKRTKQSVALMFIDLDRFKNVNDSLGHHIGDQLLKALARRLEVCLRAEDTVSRLGGDEFVILLIDADVTAATSVAEKLINVISEPLQIEQYELSITPSIGIAMYPHDGKDFTTLSKNADAAMYRTKQNGRNNFCFFTHDMQTLAAKTLRLDNALRRAIDKNQLKLYYQPKINLTTGKLAGAEALIRWIHPEMGMISPAEFIPIAEDSGQILQIGEWVMREAARQLKVWQGKGVADFTMAINLSVVQFRFQELPELVESVILEEGISPQDIELELTESASMDNPEKVIVMMDRLHAIGFKLAIDDFGTGYSSLSYLKRLKVNKLKIDQSFVRDIMDDPDDKAIVNAIIHLAKNLGMSTIAEGVETEAQLDYLRESACEEGQGYFISKPLPAEEFLSFYQKFNAE